MHAGPQLAAFQALGLSLLNCGTGLLCPVGGEREGCNGWDLIPKACSPLSLSAKWPQSWEFSRKKNNNNKKRGCGGSTAEISTSYFGRIAQAQVNTGKRNEFWGAPTVTKQGDSIFPAPSILLAAPAAGPGLRSSPQQHPTEGSRQPCFLQPDSPPPH